MEALKIESGGIAQFDLSEYEWYGDNPDTAIGRQTEVRHKLREVAMGWRCDHIVAYCTPDDIFSVSPQRGRHKVLSENISPLMPFVRITVSQSIKAIIWDTSNDEDQEYIMGRAKEAIESAVAGLVRNNRSTVAFEIRCGETVLAKGAL